MTLKKLFEMHTDLVATMNRTFDVFKNDGNEVSGDWNENLYFRFSFSAWRECFIFYYNMKWF